MRTPLLILSLVLGSAASAQDGSPSGLRFAPLDVTMDCDGAPLAAYQLELVADGDAQIVGVEGGESKPFSDAPYYDPAALMHGRIVVAAFSTAADLPSTSPRLLTLHLRLAGAEPTFSLKVIASVDREGRPIACRFDLKHRSQP
ncbi:MAG: hypothetical protein ABIJ09_20540 [Pseudomonadota bacterium]